MKKIFLAFSLLCITSVFSQEKIDFSIGYFQNFGDIFVKQDGYRSEKFDLVQSIKGLKAGIYVPIGDGWHYNIDFDFSLLADSGKVIKTYDDPTLLNIATYKTSQYGITYFINRKVSKWLCVGAGLKVEFRKTNFVDFFWQGISVTRSEFDDTGGAAVFPINVDFYLPIGSRNIIWKNSLQIALENKMYLQSALNFQF